MNDPRFFAIIFIVFLLLGVYNVFTGLRRQREAQLNGRRIHWYRQINILTGVEYLLLSLVFAISLNLRNNSLPVFLHGLVLPLYLLVLAASAILAVFVVRQSISNARQLSRNSAAALERNTKLTGSAQQVGGNELTPEQRAANAQRRRDRRQKAAAARRRRTGN